MPGLNFISYSAVDAEKFALKLADDLQSGPPSFPVWIFRRELHASAGDWDAQVNQAIRDCDSLIFVMSRDSVTEESNCKPEWIAALKYKKPILLVRLHADASAPFRIASRQYVDFAGDYNVGLAIAEGFGMAALAGRRIANAQVPLARRGTRFRTRL